MTAHSYQPVLDELTAELASRRRERIQLDGAYLALARAILDDNNDVAENKCSSILGCWHSARVVSSARLSVPA